MGVGREPDALGQEEKLGKFHDMQLALATPNEGVGHMREAWRLRPSISCFWLIAHRLESRKQDVIRSA